MSSCAAASASTTIAAAASAAGSDGRRRWLRVLQPEVAPVVVGAIADCLQHGEAVSLLVCALETRLELLARVLFSHAHLLLLGDPRKARASVLHCAAAHGRVSVVQWALRHRSMRSSRAESVATAAAVRPFVIEAGEACPSSSPSPLSSPVSREEEAAAMAWVNRNTPYVFPAEVMYEAARQGDLRVVAWLHTTSRYESYRAMEFAASRGRLEVAQWLYDHRDSALQQHASSSSCSSLSSPSSAAAAASAAAATAATRRSSSAAAASSPAQPPSLSATSAAPPPPPPPPEACAPQIYMLAPLGAADVMNWITVFPRGKYFREAFATRRGLYGSYDQRDCGSDIDWTRAEARDAAFARRRFKALDLAAAEGDLALVQRLHADKTTWPCTPQAMDNAARNGHLDVVQWLHAHRTEGCTSSAIAGAASNGHFAIARWLRAHRSEGCRGYALDLAATHGHLEILQWLYREFPRHSCSQASVACAAGNNHRRVLRWLHEEKGLVLDVHALEAAIANGHLELAQWLFEREPALQEQLATSAVAKAARSGHTALTQWLVRDLGLWSPRALAGAAIACNLELVEWLHGVGKPSELVSSRELFAIGERCAFAVVEWLLRHGCAKPKFENSPREFSALFASARSSWSDTKGSSNTTSTQFTSGSRAFAWDLHTKEYPSWLRKYAELVFSFCPDFLHSSDAGPILAAQRGELRILQVLAAGNHPEVYTTQTYHAIIAHTKAGDVLQWLHRTAPAVVNGSSRMWYLDASVIHWATAYKQVGFLKYFFSLDAVVDERFRRHAIEDVVHTACRHGHVDMLRWSIATIKVGSMSLTDGGGDGDESKSDAEAGMARWKATLWRAASVEAATYGHTAVLAWIASERPCAFEEGSRHCLVLADAAMENGHVCVLKWVASALVPGGRLVVRSKGLARALANKHVDVLRFVVGRRGGGETSGGGGGSDGEVGVGVDAGVAIVDASDELRAAIAAFLATESEGFVPLEGLTYVLPPL